MNGGDRRRTASSSGDRSIVCKIMQRFRPIAPKPVAGGSLNKTEDEELSDAKRSIERKRRYKRRYVRVRSKYNNSNNNNNNSSGYKREIMRAPTVDLDKDTDGHGSGSHKDIVTLQLLPEKEEDLGTREGVFGFTDSISTCHCTNCNNYRDPLPGVDRMTVIPSSSDRPVVESRVMVECVTGTCTEEAIRNHLGRTDTDVMRCLELDTCPGFVSDGSNRVRWINGSYRKMMGLNGGEDVRVWVVVTVDQMEEMACMGELYGAVTCRVRVQYDPTWRKKSGQTVPCDVWKIGSGGFAWRLDVEAALCLGR